MNRGGGCLLALALGSSPGWAADLSPQDFAFGLPVVTTKDAAVYRFELPLEVYRGTARDDLGDVRLFNAQAEAVPYSLLRPSAPSQTHAASTELPMIPLRGNSRAILNGARLVPESPGSAPGAGIANTAAGQYVLDGRGLDTAVAALQVNWPPTTVDYSGRVKIEASDDLESWQTLVAAAPAANLHANGQALIENRIGFSPTKAKFWRLSWIGPPPRFELTSVLAQPANDPAQSVHASLDVEGASSATEADADLFDLGAHLPVSRVNVILPETNTVNTIELSSRRAPGDPWRTVTQAGFYRLKTAEGEQQNAAVDILIDRDRYWRARILRGGGLPRTALRLHLEWVPNEVTFLARGRPPFLLAYGNSAVSGAEVDLAQVPADVEIAPAGVGKVRTLGGAGRLNPPPVSAPHGRLGLWIALSLSAFLLGWVVFRVLRAD